MIAHRAWRDISRCRNKYGDAWLEYERRVPYLFIPVSQPKLISWSRRETNAAIVRHLIVEATWAQRETWAHVAFPQGVWYALLQVS